MARILITCFGSYGDLHPYIALAKQLQARGHEPIIGTSLLFQEQIQAEGIAFTHLRSNLDRYNTPVAIRALLQRLFDPKRGGELITKEMMINIEASYADTLEAVKKADLVISHPLAFTTPIICRTLNTPWLSSALAPMFFMSVYEPPIMSPAPWLRTIHRLSPALYRVLFSLLKKSTKAWVKPLYQLCEKHHLSAPSGHPIFEGQYSPHGTLAMFPPCFAQPQIDWPPHTQMTGFPLFSVEMANNEQQKQLQTFLDAGDAPIVFALGSSAVNIAEDFYRVSAAIARKLNKRAVLVCGEHSDHVDDIPPGEDLFIINYVAYDKLFPQACLVVHQGGIGTLAHSLTAQCPVLVVPFGFDQFDNGERVEKLGVGKSLARQYYDVDHAAPVVSELLTQASYKTRAQQVSKQVSIESNTDKASQIIEQLLNQDMPIT